MMMARIMLDASGLASVGGSGTGSSAAVAVDSGIPRSSLVVAFDSGAGGTGSSVAVVVAVSDSGAAIRGSAAGDGGDMMGGRSVTASSDGAAIDPVDRRRFGDDRRDFVVRCDDSAGWSRVGVRAASSFRTTTTTTRVRRGQQIVPGGHEDGHLAWHRRTVVDADERTTTVRSALRRE